jgi:hypothetical protein
VALEKHLESGDWAVIGLAPIRKGRFSLRWRPKVAGHVSLRLAVRRRGHDLASSETRAVLVGSPPEYCAEPPPPTSVPTGDGWIIGGLYISGGPAPGICSCQGGPYTVTATDETGATVATQQVVGRPSYTFVLPPGRYTLKAGSCGFSQPALVSAGARTKADTVCNVP